MKTLPANGIVGEVALRETAATEMGQVMGLVRAALQATIGANAYFCVESMFPDRAIVCKDGRYYQYPYSIGADNAVTVGTPAEVTEQWTPVRMAEAAMVSLIEAKDAEGAVWDVRIIRSGVSANKVYYSPAMLREAVPLFEGARVYARPDIEHVTKGPMESRDVNKLAGWISAPHFAEAASEVLGTLNLSPSPLRTVAADAWKRGKRDLIGLSINARGEWDKSRMVEGVQVRVAKSIKKVDSVDLIIEPGAGGGLVRMVEAASDKEPDVMKERMLATIKAKAPKVYAKINLETVTDEQLEAHYAEALASATEASAGTAAAATIVTGITMEQLNEHSRMVEARANMRVAIAGSKLPQVAQDKLLKQFIGRDRFVEADVESAIKEERVYLARMTESGKVTIGENGDVQVEDRSLKMGDMMDAFFDAGHKNHRDVQSFKECYREITGDKLVSGRWADVNRSRMAESVGAVFRESLDSSTFSSVLGDSIARRMIAEFKAAVEFDAWRKIATSVPVQDFRTQDRTLFGGYGDLPTVAQGDPYTAATSPTDTQATYAVTKKGYTEDVTLEMIKNDDVGAIRRIPVKMGRAAKRTLAKFVFDFIKTNPAIYDSVALFHASHSNLGSTAFSATEYGVVRAAMMKQTELSSSDRMGIGPYAILCPVDLEAAVWTAFQRSTNNDKDFIQTLAPLIIPVWYWTDATDWAAAANPNDLPGIEIGFLDGQEEPQLFVQDAPNVGSMFSNDKLTYKLRHIYGGNVLPGGYAAFYKEVVAG